MARSGLTGRPIGSMVQMKLRPVQDRPEDIGDRLRLFVVGLSPLDESHQQRQLVRPRAGESGSQGKGFRPDRECPETGPSRSRPRPGWSPDWSPPRYNDPFIIVSAWIIVVSASTGRSSRRENNSRKRARASPASEPVACVRLSKSWPGDRPRTGIEAKRASSIRPGFAMLDRL